MNVRKSTLSRVVLILMLVGVIGFPSRARAQPTARLYVFLQTQATPRALQKSLGEHLPGVEVTVFGRFKDFEKAMQDQAPDALLAPLPVLSALGMSAALQGTKGSATSEPYVLVSVGAEIGDASTKTIGAVDLLGRDGMSKFVSGLLSIVSPKVKRVTKIDDLLPLLQFQAADAILLPESAGQGLKKKSTLDLRMMKIANSPVGLAALAVLSGGKGASIVAGLKTIKADLKQMIGVEGWK